MEYIHYNVPGMPSDIYYGTAGISFRMVSHPRKTDSDGDGDIDSVDPHPVNYQLNDRFIYNTDLLYDLAVEYNTNNPLNSEKYNGKPAEALVFMFIRYHKLNPNTGEKGWYCYGLWPGVPGSLDEGFINFVFSKDTKLYYYFENTSHIKSAPDKEDVDLYHMAATISAYIYESDKVDGLRHTIMPENHINALAGWAGDLQSLVLNCARNAPENNTGDDRYSNSPLVDLFISRLGYEDNYFSQEDFNTDADAVNIQGVLTK